MVNYIFNNDRFSIAKTGYLPLWLKRMVKSPEISQLPLAYRATKQRIRKQLGSRWRPGDKLPPIDELAKQMDTGRANTYRAVRELASEGLLISRRRLGTYVTQTSSDGGPSRVSLTGRIVVAPMYHFDGVQDFDPYTHEAMSVLQQSFQAVGATLKTERLHSGVHGKLVLPEDADAAVIVNPNSLQYVQKQDHQALVVINTADETIVNDCSGYDVVTLNQEHGGLLAGRRLRESGCSAACFLGVYSPRFDCWSRTSMARLSGFERGWSEQLIRKHMIRCADYSEAAGAMAVSDYLALSPRPDAIFAVTDEVAVGFITGALSHGLHVGKDYKIIGFDGQPRGRSVHRGPLTTLDAPLKTIADKAAELIAARLADPTRSIQKLSIQCNLFDGKTA